MTTTCDKTLEGHTPGPWNYKKTNRFVSIYPPDDHVQFPIASVSNRNQTIEQSYANAALIAAAPALQAQHERDAAEIARLREALEEAEVSLVENLPVRANKIIRTALAQTEKPND